MSYPAQTSGVGVAANIKVQGNETPLSTTPGKNNVTISLSGANSFPETFQLNAEIVDAAGTPVPGTAFVLTAVANASAGVAAYTGTITGGGSNAFAGRAFNVTGFATNAVNNGSFVATASSATVLTLANAAAIAETHAAVATEESTAALKYVAYGASSLASGTGGELPASANLTKVATVSATGLITGVTAGGTTVEVSYPTFNNSVGNVASSGNVMNGLPINKIYAEVNVTVVP